MARRSIGDAAQLRPPAAEGAFAEAELEGLPEPVARYFRAAIAPGAPLARAGELEMRGRLRLGPRWLSMRGSELIAPRQGFVWRARVARVIAGADRYLDGRGEMDWKLLGLVPLVHAEGPDISRSTAGRVAAEAVWVPTALLPRFGVGWEATSDHDLVARVAVGSEEVVVELRIDDAGAVRWVRLDRWGDPDETGTFARHRFGFEVTGHRRFGPLTIPAAGRAGWHPGGDRWSTGEFFRCEITRCRPVDGTPSGAPVTRPTGTPSLAPWRRSRAAWPTS